MVALPPAPVYEAVPKTGGVFGQSQSPESTDLAFSQLIIDDRLQVLIVGAGFAGLSTAIACARQGFAVTVLERSTGLSPHGDNIMIGANAGKILNRWGIGDEMWERSCKAGWWLFKDSAGNDVGSEDLRPYPAMYGAPLLAGHRAHFLGSLGVECRMLGVKIRLETEVTKYHDSRHSPSVVVGSGEVIFADVILVCDGVNSQARSLLTGRPKPQTPSDYSIHRAAMKADTIRADKKCAHLLDGSIRTWVGDDCHVVLSSMDHGRQIAFSFTHREVNGQASLNWRDRKPITEVLRRLNGWDPILVRALEKFQTSLNWTIPNDKPGEDWISTGGRIAFAGDSIHPMMPTTFQGGSSAIEDGATIAICLALAAPRSEGSKTDVRLALRVYETLRRPRVDKTFDMGLKQRKIWHSFEATRDILSLTPLTTGFYDHDAENYTLAMYESVAKDFDINFVPTPRKTWEKVWEITGVSPRTSPEWMVTYSSSIKPVK